MKFGLDFFIAVTGVQPVLLLHVKKKKKNLKNAS